MLVRDTDDTIPLAYYNDIDPYCCQWLQNLIDAGLIPPGFVDNRSIVDIQPHEISRYRQVHLFAGLGGWAYALQLAGWPEHIPVWTGSCPCQPFSAAGKRKGTADARHLWPEMRRLITECRPAIAFGEQVAGKDGIAWLGLVLADLEKEGYQCGAAVLPACSQGAPHVRNRIYWTAHTDSSNRDRWNSPMQVGRGQGQKATATNFWGENPKRAIESSIPVVAYGVPARMERCCAAGNAIVPQVAAEFITAYMEAVGILPY